MGRAAERPSRGAGGRRGPAAGRRSPATGRRGGQAQPRRRQSSGKGPSISWTRRAGIVGALLIAGVSVVVAGQALGPRGTPDGSPSPSASAPGATQVATPAPSLAAAPLLDPPAATLTRDASVILTGRLAERLDRATHRLRVYLNGELERERGLPRRRQFSIDVPLAQGLNTITVAVSGPAGESLHSTPVEITRDSLVPAITLLEPASGPVYAPDATLRGTSEPGATLRVTNNTSGWSTSVLVADDGAFEAHLDLLAGNNEIVLEARDQAGNTGRASIALERREGTPGVELTLSRTALDLAELPTSISLRAEVRDAAGAPVEGAEVIFSLSPPGVPTLTYNATTLAGVARWPSVRISDAAAAGEGLATVLVTLPGGETLTTSVYFTIEE